MAIADTSKTRIAYIAESTFGTTPSTPTFKELRRTNGGLQLQKGTVRSDEINLDRNVRDEFAVSHDITGSIDFQMSHATLDDMLEAVMGGTWAANVLKAGGTSRSFTFEETIDIGGGNFSYQRFVGTSVNTMELNVAARQAARGSIGLMGRSQAQDTAIITGATYTASNAEPIMTADSVASLSVASLSGLNVKSLSLNISNNLRIRDEVGSLYTQEFGMGQIDITGRMSVYFESNDLMTEILNHGSGTLQFTIGPTTNKKYTFKLGTIKFLNGPIVLGGRDDDVMQEVEFRAIYNSSDTSSIVVTRVVA
jgi:hypothetical protein